jgi:hypothetical protein
VAARRLADAGHDRIAGVADLTRLVAQGAGPDAVGEPVPDLGDEIRVGDLGARHLDRVTQRSVVGPAERPLRLAGVDH